MAQQKVKSGPSLPYWYKVTDKASGNVLDKITVLPGTEGMGFEQFVDPSGNLWVRVADLVATAGSVDGTADSTSLRPFQVDAHGNAYAAPPNATANGSALQTVTSTAYEASHLIKTTPGVVFGVSGYNSRLSTQFILLFDHGADSVPPDGAVPAVSPVAVAASSNFSIDFGYWGMPFKAGIWITNSTTAMTKTIGSADCSFTVRYK